MRRTKTSKTFSLPIRKRNKEARMLRGARQKVFYKFSKSRWPKDKSGKLLSVGSGEKKRCWGYILWI